MTRRQIERIARKAGIAIEISIDRRGTGIGEAEILAPVGMVFIASGCHYYVSRAGDFDDWTMKDVYGDLSRAIGYGLEPCDDKDCDICREDKVTQ